MSGSGSTVHLRQGRLPTPGTVQGDVRWADHAHAAQTARASTFRVSQLAACIQIDEGTAGTGANRDRALSLVANAALRLLLYLPRRARSGRAS
jgi:hypothetical protein